MSGLMKTTSRSESINAFFNVFHEFHNNLRLFLVSFDHAIDIQSQIHAADEVKMKQTVPQMLTRSVLEAYAARVYSRTMFFDVQEELCLALHDCVWDGSEIVDGKKVYTILDDVGGSDKHSKFEVVRDVCNGTIDCSCNLFIRNGYLCRHAFKVLFNEKAQIIPDRYVLQRWRRDLIPVVWLPAKVRYGESDAETEKIISELNIVYEDMIEKLRNDKEALSEFLDDMKDRYSKISVDEPDQTRCERKNSNFKEFLGVTDVTSVDVFPPSGVRNKGCGKGKRLIGVREKAAKKASKPKRVCRKCGKLASHDSRNCTEE